MTKPDLPAIQSRLDKATPGRWYAATGVIAVVGGNGFECRTSMENINFISEAHQDIPALLSYIAELEAKLKRIESILDPGGSLDAYHNLGGAIIDIDHHPEHIADEVDRRTLKRVEGQLGKIQSIIAASEPNPITENTKS